MGKNRKLIVKFLIAFLCMNLLLLNPAYADVPQNETARSGIEQVFINLPEIYVYSDALSAKEREYTAYLGGEKLAQKSVMSFRESGQGIYYFILLDISNSIPTAYFNNIKTDILEFQNKLGPKDKLFLYTFGEAVEKKLDGNQSSDYAAKILKDIKNKDNRTSLFDAVHIASGEAKKIKPEENTRRIILAISDGEDVALGKKTNAEALKALNETGIPVYAFGIRDTNKENLNSFGEFARASGGSLTIFKENEFGGALQGFTDSLDSQEVIALSTKNNICSNKKESFSIHFQDDKSSYTKEVMVDRWIEDKISPTILEVVSEGEKGIKIHFDEAVLGASEPQSYQIVRKKRIGAKDAKTVLNLVEKVKNGPTFEDIPITVSGVSKIDETTYQLTTTENLTSGQYFVSCPGITDASMEKNGVVSAGSLEITEGAEAANDDALVNRWKVAFDNWAWRSLLFAIALGIILLFVSHLKIQKKLSGNIRTAEDSAKKSLETRADFSKQERDRSSSVQEIKIWLEEAGGKTYQGLIKKERCITGGRGSICELRFEDTGMSRKHFTLEWSGEQLYIKDLNTTNGTKVNDQLISGNQILECGDRISAGSSILTIRW